MRLYRTFTVKKCVLLALLAMLIGVSVTACGKKGPLYLPGTDEKKTLSHNFNQ